MILSPLRRLAPTVFVLSLGLAAAAQAGSFKRIVIDGAFDDWAGVPVLADDEEGGGGIFDFKDIAVANDEHFLYVRLRLHAGANYAGFHHQVVVDGDGDTSTGLSWLGLGSEMLIEDGGGYQQKNGEFNEGGVSLLDWQAAPAGGSVAQVELRFSRATQFEDGASVLSASDIVLSFVARNLDWQEVDAVQAVPYAIAETPAPFVGNATLIDYLEAVWTHREGPSETDPLWASPEFTPGADWGEGEGFLGFGLPNGVYPAVTAPLDQGSASYYLRTTFDWNFDSRGVALLADLYLSDGATLWLNGREVRRVRMPEGDITAATPATGETTNPGVVETFSLPVSALAVGANLLAVELHQAPGSLDTLGFGLSLRASDNDPPAILNSALPEDREVVEGQGTIFSAGAVSGTEPFAYQWFKDGVLLFGEESPQLKIPRVLVDDAGVYAVEIKNGSDTVRSRDAVLTTVAEPVAFTNASAPADRTVKEGLATTFEAPVTGSPEFRWQWYKDNAAIDGQNGPVLSFDAVQLGDEGAYHVVVSNRVNPVTSRQARLDVTADAAAAAVEFVTGGSGRIVVRFSEPVEQASALDPRSYVLPGVAIQELSLSDDGRTVTLFTGAFPFGEVVPLRVEGVKDLFGNATSAAAPFRATILIDGDFSDWTGIAPAASDPSDLDEGGEFKDYWIANDGEHLYLRFSFHRDVGQLPVNHFYQIYFDADNDPGTGLQVGGIGSSMMIENGLGWLQRGGGFNEGGVGATGFLLAPQFGASEFECRISLASAVNADRSPVFTGDTVAVSFVLMTSSWAVVDRGPVETTIVHSLAEWLPPTASAPFAITSLTRNPANRSVSVTWSATADGVYAVETSADLRDWEEVDDGLTSEGEPEASYGFVGPAGSAPLYVRIRKL